MAVVEDAGSATGDVDDETPTMSRRPESSNSAAVAEFERQRSRIFGLAYRMLGSATDAEDIVQDAFLRWHGTEPGMVQDPAAWLVKVTTNLCRNRLSSAAGRRERYVGPWLPEPVMTPDSALGPLEAVEQRDTVSLGFLVLAERLTPQERAVFVLREAFGYSHREVAEFLELSVTNCRQLHSRARRRIAAAGLPREMVESSSAGALLERFLDAARGGDLTALARMLADDVISVADGGGASSVARLPVRGVDKVARYLATAPRRYGEGLALAVREVNGMPAVLARYGATLVGVMVPEIVNGRISCIRIIANPDKLRFLGAQADRLSHSEELSGS
ncbi:RNA polymerase sigma factor SigJ [Nocardia sp. NPDC051990]|uniref:RNA polymerase sigma factor SigJ n=1 Tax=Nocardia sp. NPDC051990 TaxID=3155285 RepID=UPI00343032F5